MVIGLDIDDTIKLHPEVFSLLSHALVDAGHKVIVITFREDRQTTETTLEQWDIVYNKLITPTPDGCFTYGVNEWKAEMCHQHDVDIFFDYDPHVDICFNYDPSAFKHVDESSFNKEAGKPYTRKELTLPPLPPEYYFSDIEKLAQACLDTDFTPAMRRLLDLPAHALITVERIKTEIPSLEERRRLLYAFTLELLEAMRAVTEFANSCQNSDLTSYIERYRTWECKLLFTFKRAWQGLLSSQTSNARFIERIKEQVGYLSCAIRIATKEAEHSESGEFKSALVNVKTDKKEPEHLIT
jgi:hypothetical protein